MSVTPLDAAEMETHSAFHRAVEDLAQAELQRLEGEEKSLAEALQSVKAEVKAARQVLQALNPPEPKAKDKPRSRSSKKKTLSDERRLQAAEWLKGLPEGQEITSALMAESLGWGSSFTQHALLILRQDGLVRLTGTGGSRGMTKFYRSMI